MATTLLGPMLPGLSARWAISDAAAGALFTAQFAGTLTTTFFSSAIAGRLGASRALALGFLLLGAGVGALGIASSSFGWAFTVLYGLGLGLVLPLTNNVVASLAGAKAASALSLVNVAWGVGAMTWPLVVRAGGMVDARAPTTLLAMAALVMAVAWAATPVAQAWTGVSHAEPADDDRRRRVRPAVALYGALILLYVGSETALSGWATEFARRMPGGGVLWTYAATAFWASQTAGRLVAPVSIRLIGETRLLVLSLGLGCAATLAMVGLVGTAAQVMVVAALTGFALAPVFPLLWARVIRDVAPVWPGAAGPLFAAGGVGGAALPWSVGVVSGGYGLGVGLAVPLVSLAAMLALTLTRRT
jgi:fucose permease